MTDNLTDHLPADGPRDTNPMLERILEELRATREDVAALTAKVDAIGRDLRDEIADTREVFRQELGLEMRNVRATVADHERRLRTLEERRPAP